MNFLAILEKQSRPFLLLVIFTTIGAIGILDFVTGYELAFSVFYVLPISLVTWLMSRRLGFAASLVSTVVWLGADMATGHPYSQPLIPFWNSFIRLTFFAIITVLLSALRKATNEISELARLDSLTGAINSRFFYELAQREIDRCTRYKHPFTLAYIDLDNFKTVNDRFGHPAGDQILRIVVNSTKKHLRKTDVIARLGGDEFALLLPETNEESARVALSKIQDILLQEMQQSNWLITFSIGALISITPPSSTDELVRMADDLMYLVKHSGKNAIKYSIYTG
jgi:diguanylate cyclase (GGDEF)-like protein